MHILDIFTFITLQRSHMLIELRARLQQHCLGTSRSRQLYRAVHFTQAFHWLPGKLPRHAHHLD